jgi:hypothetical protein
MLYCANGFNMLKLLKALIRSRDRGEKGRISEGTLQVAPSLKMVIG